MPLTLLFDLDDTLLDTNMDAFIPAYFQALSTHLSSLVAPDVMLRALLQSTALMNESDDITRTLQKVFEADFYPKLGIAKEVLSDAIEDFYDNIFPTIGKYTTQRPEASTRPCNTLM